MNQHLSTDDPITLLTRAQRVGGEFLLEGIEDGELDILLEELEDAGRDDDVEWFDAVLAAIYDWADYNRVWLGG